jgi:hypothetical protein
VATTTTTTSTYRCDLCNTEVPLDQLHRFGLVQIGEGEVTYYHNPEITGPPRDVCQSCQQRPITELITSLNTQKDEENENPTAHLTPASMPPLPPNWPGRRTTP